jgi:polyhydroxybutyrate depolymerase
VLVLAAGGAASGCSSGSAARTTSGTTAVLSAGCGRVPDPGPTGGATFGDVAQTLDVGGVARAYRLAVPADYRSSRPTPLILLFHGSGSDAVQQSAYSQLPARGAAASFLVATPDAVGGNWDLAAPGTPTPDQQFVTALLADLGSRYCVARDRVDAAGISLGSQFAALMACDPANHLAAVGLVAAEYLIRPCTGPVPVLAFHGTADPIVPYADGATGRSVPGIPVVGVERNLAAWARLDGCPRAPRVDVVAPAVVRRRWTPCRLGTTVTLYTVLGGGHTWPGSPVVLPAATFGPTDRSLDATGLMLRFFGSVPASYGR